jgi:gluconate 2-dehydrogenase alpha chain
VTERQRPVDVVIVGFGWTGAIMAAELGQEGLSGVAIERGDHQDTVPNWSYPKVVDEIQQSARNGLLQNLSRTTVTLRHDKTQTAVPYRQIGSFTFLRSAWGNHAPAVTADQVKRLRHLSDKRGRRG